VVTVARVAIFMDSATEPESAYVGSAARSGGDHGGTFLYPRSSFATQDGLAITLTSTLGSTNQPYDDGARVRLLYDPHDLEHANVNSLLPWLPTLFLAPFGLFFARIPAIIFRPTEQRLARPGIRARPLSNLDSDGTVTTPHWQHLAERRRSALANRRARADIRVGMI
jgi:hypothetical protein